MKEFIKQNWIILSACLVCLSIITVCSVIVVKKDSSESNTIVISLKNMKNIQTEKQAPMGSYVMTKDEFEEFKTQDTAFTYTTYDEYVAGANAQFMNTSSSFTDTSSSMMDSNPTITAKGANGKLYNYCDKYFQCYYGTKRISPIFPLALANVETPGRADNNITWSALYPSRYAKVEDMDKFDVTYVVKDPKVFAALTKEYSTRDRGALQMSPTYGAGNSSVNRLMSGNEKEKLSHVDTTGCSSWASGAASEPGDRFYLPDVCLRLQSAINYNIVNIAKKGYAPESDYQLLAMLAISHNSGSGVWSMNDKNRKIGNWYGAQACYDWCAMCGSQELVSAIEEYADTHTATYINQIVAWEIWNKVYPDVNYSAYTTSRINAAFPIEVIYAYIKLTKLYTK